MLPSLIEEQEVEGSCSEAGRLLLRDHRVTGVFPRRVWPLRLSVPDRTGIVAAVADGVAAVEDCAESVTCVWPTARACVSVCVCVGPSLRYSAHAPRAQAFATDNKR